MTKDTNVDALVVGAGVGGIYATYVLSNKGFNVKCIDMAGDVGGTWYWNRYPGAMSDTESYLYRYSWDKEDLQTYPWTHHYVYQPDILKYLQHIVAKHDLRKYMQFKCEMKTATWDENIQRWRTVCSTGETIVSRYLINALGLLCKANYPKIDGLNTFKGQLLHTATWDDSAKLDGKRVGVIGNGSTGVQVLTALAPTAGKLVSFQRNPQYSVPSGQGPVTAEYRADINARYDEIWENVFKSGVGFGVPESTRKTMEATPEERREAFQKVWDQGNGFRFMFSAFGDLTTNIDANKEACDFIKSKIDEIVKDPRKANALKPTELYARRPLCDSGYYQIFNQDNVDIVSLRETPIQEITPQGIKLSDGIIHELDVLIFATGFEAIEGSYTRVCIKGRDGETMQDHWKSGLKAYGSIACSGFPNMFIVAGPQGAFANFPPVIESEVRFITKCIEYAEGETHHNQQTNGNVNGYHKSNRGIVEVKPEAEQGWSDLCDDLVGGSVFTTTKSWIFGQNIEGRKANTNFFFGGLKAYLDWVQKETSTGFPGFTRT
ncbi:unnamed protein product [Clonostachys rosea]|uniref:FAD/NAD(P)-binding domain-containing protein n=1 Tax=Bionectria ochroleuca TaxID=29856 RepID=A0ABY6UKF5_BIOOC|nr:unnamed protein product [Clonostachys rosea]